MKQVGCNEVDKSMNEMEEFDYTVEQFADLQLLRYKVYGFEELSLKQKKLIYYLSQAALQGRDILFDQNGKYNLLIRKMLETVYTEYQGDRTDVNFVNLETYLKRIWFSNGIHHHYASNKFVPGFTPEFFRDALNSVDALKLPLGKGETVEELCEEVFPVIFDSEMMPKRVNQADGEDLVLTSAANYYEGVTQKEAEDFYHNLKNPDDMMPVMFGMNSRLVKEDGKVQEKVWRSGGLYGQAIDKIIYWLDKALGVAEDAQQKIVIEKLIRFYKNGDLKDFDEYSIAWVKDLDSRVDFVNGFIESYGDPLGLKASWESIVNFNPATAIGINLPNSNWIRSVHGSKSVTIGNLTEAYNKAAHGNGFTDEFVCGAEEKEWIKKYADLTGDLHTDLHECLGHGSGQLLPGVDQDALKAYGSTIEEARADLFGLYYLPDDKMVELGLTPDGDAFKAEYYTYMMNGLMTQLVRIELGNMVEEAHMRNRQLIARWTFEKGAADKVVEMVKKDGKTYVKINDYQKLRTLFGQLLAEIQRIKSEGDFEAARKLVEKYAVKIDPVLHAEILARYEKLHLAPYKGFVNPVYEAVTDKDGNIIDVKVSYNEGYAEQMLRYSKEFANLPYRNE